jgi:hypothetical protein
LARSDVTRTESVLLTPLINAISPKCAPAPKTRIVSNSPC